MKRTLVVILFCLAVAFIGLSAMSKFFDGRKIQDLRDRQTVLQVVASASDERQAVLMAQLATDSVVRDSLEHLNTTLRHDLQRAKTQRVRIVHVRDSVRATINEDTLSAGYRNLLLIEREMAEVETTRADLAEGLLKSADAQIATLLERQRALRILLLDVTAQRDSALTLSSDAIALVSPSFFAKLFQDIPRKAACAGAGAIIAEMNNGKALTGAAVALGICLAVEAIF